MKKVSITINGTKHQLQFNWKALKLFANKQGIKYVDDIFNVIAKAFTGKQIEIQSFDMLGNLILSAIQSVNPDAVIDPDDIVGELMFNQAKMDEIMAAFNDVVPKAKPDKSVTKKKGK